MPGPLVPSEVQVDFVGGLDTKTERKRVIPAKLLDLENAILDGGSIRRRPGTRLLTDTVSGSGVLTEASAVVPRVDEVLRWTSTGVYSRATDAAPTVGWVSRGGADVANPVGYTVEHVVARPRSVEAHDCVSVGNLDVVVWTEAEEAAIGARRVLRASVVDRVTRATYVDAVELAGTTQGVEVWRYQPRLVAFPNGVAVFYVSQVSPTRGTPCYRTLLLSNPSTWTSEVQFLPGTIGFRVGPRFPFELDAVTNTAGQAIVGFTAASEVFSTVSPVALTSGIPAPGVTIQPTTTFSGTIGLKVTQAPTVTVAGGAGSPPASAIQAVRSSYAFCGTLSATITSAGAIGVAQISGPAATAPDVINYSTAIPHLVTLSIEGRPSTPVGSNRTSDPAAYPPMLCTHPAALNGAPGPSAGDGWNLKVSYPRVASTYDDVTGFITWNYDVLFEIPGVLNRRVNGLVWVDDGRAYPSVDSGVGFVFTAVANSQGSFWNYRLRRQVLRSVVSGGFLNTEQGGGIAYLYANSSGVSLQRNIVVPNTGSGLTVGFPVAACQTFTGPEQQWTVASTRPILTLSRLTGGTGPASQGYDLYDNAGNTYPISFLGLTITPQAAAGAYGVGTSWTVTASKGLFAYTPSTGGGGSASILSDVAQPTTTEMIGPGGVSTTATVTWAANVAHPLNEEWSVNVVVDNRTTMVGFNAPTGTSLPFALGPVNAAVPILEGLTLGATADGGVQLVYRNIPSSRIESRYYSAALAAGATQTVATTANSAAASGLSRMGIVTRTGGTVTAILEPLAQAPLESVTFSSTAVTVAPAVLARGLRLLTRPFLLGGRAVVGCIYMARYGGVDSVTTGSQPTAFLLAIDTKQVVARALTGEAAPATGPSLPRPLDFGDGRVGVVVPRRGRLLLDLEAGNLTDLTPSTLTALVARAVPPSELQSVVEGNALHLGGGCPLYYDGTQLVEDGFHVYPEGITVTPSTTGGSLSEGTRQWVVVYEWTDALGRRHQSAPSAPISAATTGSTGSVTLNVPTPPLTRKRGVRVVLYRTQANQPNFYRTTPGTGAYLMPDTGAAEFVNIVDGVADASIVDNEGIYSTGPAGGSTGGELVHLPPRAYTAIHRHLDYLITNAMDDGLSVEVSLPLPVENGASWNEALRFQVPAGTGRVVAFATLDEALVIKTETADYVVGGYGPNAAGTDNGFSPPRYLTGSLGALSWRVVVRARDGVFFKAATGIHLLTRSLDTLPVGEGVARYEALTVTGAVDVPQRQEVRFYTSQGTTLVYCYDASTRQWATFTGQPAASGVAACRNGQCPVFADGAQMLKEDATGFDDYMPATGGTAGQVRPVKVGTAWLQWAGIQGLQRIWRAVLLVEAGQGFGLAYQALYDYEETPEAGSTGGGTFSAAPALYLRHHLKRQLCKSLRLVWTLTPEAGQTPGDFILSALSLEFGVERGTARRGQRGI